jgi:putative transcriptional regulator
MQGSPYIQFRLAEVARERGVVVKRGPHKGKVSLTKILNGTGAAYTTIFPLLRHPEQAKGISFDLLERLCRFLDCQPGDLIKYVPDPLQQEYKLPEREWVEEDDEAIEGSV